MTTIRALCPDCNDVELTPEQVSLHVCNNPDLSYYQFTCPTCGQRARKPATDHIVSLLVSGGVPASVWEVPAEALDPNQQPRLGYDDLLDFALNLGTTDLLAERAQASS